MLTQLTVALSFYASGTFQQTIGDNFNISQPAVCQIIKQVSKSLATKSNEFVLINGDPEEIRIKKELLSKDKFS